MDDDKKLDIEIKHEIKKHVECAGMNLTEVTKELYKDKDISNPIQAYTNKVRKGTLRYSEAKKIAEIIGMEIKWVNKD